MEKGMEIRGPVGDWPALRSNPDYKAAGARRRAAGRGVGGVSAARSDRSRPRCGPMGLAGLGGPKGEKQVQAALDRREDAHGRGRGAGRHGREDGAGDGDERLRAAPSRRRAGAQGAPGAPGGADPGIGGRFLRPGTDRSPAPVSVGRVAAHGNTPAVESCRDHGAEEAVFIEPVTP